MKKLLTFMLSLICFWVAFGQNIDIWSWFVWKNEWKYSDLYYWNDIVYRLWNQYITGCEFWYEETYTWNYSECFPKIVDEIKILNTSSPKIFDLLRTWSNVNWSYNTETKTLTKDLENWFYIQQTPENTSLIFSWNILKTYENKPNETNNLNLAQNYGCPNEEFEQSYDLEKIWSNFSEKQKIECIKSINLVRFWVYPSQFWNIFNISYFDEDYKDQYFDIEKNQFMKIWEKRFCWNNGISYPSEKFLIDNWLDEFLSIKKVNDWYCWVQTCNENTYVCGKTKDWYSTTFKNICVAKKNNATNITQWICDQNDSLNWYNYTWNWKKDALAWAYDKWITAYDNWRDFRPNNFLTREQVAKMIVLALESNSFVMNDSVYYNDSWESCIFLDDRNIDPSLQESVERLCRMWIVKWTSDWKYNPQQSLTTAQALAMLVRSIDKNWNIKNSSGSDWWKNYQDYAYKNQILQKWIFDLTINDTTKITRQEFLYLLARTIQYQIFVSVQKWTLWAQWE